MSKNVSRIFFVLMSVLLASTAPSYAQNDKLSVDGDLMKSYVEWLSRDEMQGRKTLTEGYRKAAEWAANNFKKWGLQPAGEDGTYFQGVPIKRGFTYMTGTPDLKINNQSFLMEEGDFSLYDYSTAATRVKAEVVFAGYGISASDKGLDEYADLDVKDKVVLVLKGSPKDAPEPRVRFGTAPTEEKDAGGEEWKEESTDKVKIKMAYDKGAAAILLFDLAAPDEGQRSRRYRNRDREEKGLEFERDFLALTIDKRVLHAIMKPDRQESVSGFNRRLGTIRWDIKNKNVRSMATEAVAQLKGYDNIQKYNEELENNISRNVIAKIKGTDPQLKKQYIILGGHLDHTGVRNGLVNNGADDNASGTAVVLEVARVLGEAGYKPKRTIIFCCWCGEELGLLGSRYYVENPCDDVKIDQVVTYFNFDMVGLGDKLGAPGALNFPTIWDVIKKDQDKDVISVVEPSTGGPGGSDHSAFITKGIEALAIMSSGEGIHPDFHRPEDDADKINPEILRKTGQFALQGTINLDSETEVSLLIEDRQILYEVMRLEITNINPDLEGSAWSYVDIDGYSKDKLRWRIAAMEEKPKKNLNVGIRDLDVFQGDVELLVAVSDALGAGRIDIKGSDGVWIKEGKLTRKGRDALQVIQDNKIVVNFVRPSRQILRAALATATRPFLVSGFHSSNLGIYEKIKDKKVLLGVDFDPADVETCVKRLGIAKGVMGSADNLVLFVTSTEGLDEAKKALYISLIKKSWKAEDISSGRGRRTGIAGGNLSALR